MQCSTFHVPRLMHFLDTCTTERQGISLPFPQRRPAHAVPFCPQTSANSFSSFARSCSALFLLVHFPASRGSGGFLFNRLTWLRKRSRQFQKGVKPGRHQIPYKSSQRWIERFLRSLSNRRKRANESPFCLGREGPLPANGLFLCRSQQRIDRFLDFALGVLKR